MSTSLSLCVRLISTYIGITKKNRPEIDFNLEVIFDPKWILNKKYFDPKKIPVIWRVQYSSVNFNTNVLELFSFQLPHPRVYINAKFVQIISVNYPWCSYRLVFRRLFPNFLSAFVRTCQVTFGISVKRWVLLVKLKCRVAVYRPRIKKYSFILS